MDNRKVVKDILIASENFEYANIKEFPESGIRFEFDYYPAEFTVLFKEKEEGKKQRLLLHTKRLIDGKRKEQEILWVDLYNIFYAFKLRSIDGRNITSEEMAKTMKDVHRKFKEIGATLTDDFEKISEERILNWLS